jgi:hypothetical protein
MRGILRMATIDQHVAQWIHNRKCAESIDRQYRDWQINVIFYAALHAIDAAWVQLGVNVSDHESRNQAVRNNESLASIRVRYLDLYRISKVTRYDAEPDSWLPEKYLTVPDLVGALLNPIELEVERLLGKKLRLSPIRIQE